MHLRKLTLAVAAMAAVTAAQAAIVTVRPIAGTDYETDQVISAATGASMAGMEVTVCVLGGGSTTCETKTWQSDDTETGGGASGSGWSLSLTGDTFLNPFVFEVKQDTVVRRLTINGRPGKTAFDVLGTPEGSPGSNGGLSFCIPNLESDEPPCLDTFDVPLTVVYSDRLFVPEATPTAQTASAFSILQADTSFFFYGDLYTVLDITFGDDGFTGDRLAFSSDTDNTGKIRQRINGAPTPATLALTGLALLGLAGTRRLAARPDR